MRSWFGRPSPALVISIIALFVALGTGAYAATKIDGSQLKSQSVSGNKLEKRTISGNRIKNDALTGKQILESSLGQVPSAVTADTVAPNGVNTDAIQDAAVTAPKIGTNAVNANGLTNTAQVVSRSIAIAANGNATATVACPANTQVLSGGGGASSGLVFGVESFQSGNGWLWFARNTDAANAHTIFATAVCLQP